jgi:hypothetical protein
MSNYSLDLESEVLIRQKSDVGAEAIIDFISSLDLTYFISCIEDSRDLNGEVSITHPTDLISELISRSSKDTDLISESILLNSKDILSRIYLLYREELISDVYVNESSILQVAYGLLQAPIYTQKCPTVQDCYIRESRPTLNYGSTSSLIVGNTLDGSYITLLKIDLTPYIELLQMDDILHLKTDLSLTLLGYTPANYKITAYESYSSNWDEYTTTWANYTINKSNKVFEFMCDSSFVKIDVTEYIKGLILEGRNNLNLMFCVDAEDSGYLFYFNSKESTEVAFRPYIDVHYQQESWTGYLGFDNLPSSAIIRRTRISDLFSSNKVRRTDYTHLDGDVMVRQSSYTNLDGDVYSRLTDGEELEALANILPGIDLSSNILIKRTFNDLNSEAKILVTGGSEIPSESIIYAVNDLNSAVCVIYTKEDEIDCDAIILLSSDLESSATSSTFYIDSDAHVRQFGLSELESTSMVRSFNNTNLDAIVNILKNKDIDSNAYTRHFGVSELESNVMVSGFSSTNLDALINVLKSADVDSTAITRISQLLELESSAIIKSLERLDLNSFVNIIKSLDLDSNSIVRRVSEIHIDSNALIRRTEKIEIDSSSSVLPNTYILSEVQVRRSSSSDIDGITTVKKGSETDLDSNSQLIPNNWISSEVNVTRFNSNWIDSSALIRHTKFSDIESTLENTTYITNINGETIIRITKKLDIDSLVKILHNMDIQGNAVINKPNDLESIARIRRTTFSELEATALLRQFDITEILSEIQIMLPSYIELEGLIHVIQRSKNEIECSVNINSDSRQWIPNIHGNDVFTFNSRKLPRYWKRENFIPD